MSKGNYICYILNVVIILTMVVLIISKEESDK